MTFTSRKAAFAGLATVGASLLVLAGCAAPPTDDGGGDAGSGATEERAATLAELPGRATVTEVVVAPLPAWLTLAADRERLVLAQRTFETRQKSFELTGRSFDAGAVSALGEDLWSHKPGRIDRFRLDHCGFIFQGFNLFSSLTALHMAASAVCGRPASLSQSVW